MERLPVYVIVGAAVIAIPLVVIYRTFVVDGAESPCIPVSVGHSAACLVVTLGVGVGAVLVVVGAGATPEAVLHSRALEVLVIGVDLLALAAADGVRERATVGTVGAVAGEGLSMELGHVDDAYVVL